MRIVSRVAAGFYRPDRTKIFEVRSNDLLVMLDAPEEIRRDPLFDMMVKEGSLQIVTTEAIQKLLEADPVQGTNAEGRRDISPDPDADQAAGPGSPSASSGGLESRTHRARDGAQRAEGVEGDAAKAVEGSFRTSPKSKSSKSA